MVDRSSAILWTPDEPLTIPDVVRNPFPPNFSSDIISQDQLNAIFQLVSLLADFPWSLKGF